MKKRMVYLGMIIFVFGCFGLTVYTRNPLFIYIMFGFFFLLSIISLPFYFIRLHKEYEKQSYMETDEAIEEINEKEGYNKLEYDAHQVKAVVDTWQQAKGSDIIKGLIFVFIFLGCIIGAMVCFSLGYTIWGIICFVLGVGEIILSLIIVKCLERRSMKLNKNRKYRKATAVVIKSTVSSQSSTGTKYRTNILNTTYKVFLKINDDQRISYSKEYYMPGDRVNILVDEKNPNIIQIVGKREDIFEIEE